MVPKIIHYCWLSGDPIPEKLQKCMDSWKKLLPDYEFWLWDKQRFDIHSVKWVEQAYNAKKYAFASDYIRLYAIYHYGGIYMDMDMEVIKPFALDQFVDGVNWGLDETGDIEAAYVAGVPGHPFLKEMMAAYEHKNFVNEDGTMNKTVANVYVQDFLMKHGYVKEPKMQVIADGTVKLFTADYFNCRSLLTGKLILSENSCCIHWHTVLWASPMTKFVGWMRMKVLIPLLGIQNYGKIQKLFNRI